MREQQRTARKAGLRSPTAACLFIELAAVVGAGSRRVRPGSTNQDIALVPARRAWWSEDLESVACRNRDESRHVRVTLHRWWRDPFGGGLTNLSQEPLEL